MTERELKPEASDSEFRVGGVPVRGGSSLGHSSCSVPDFPPLLEMLMQNMTSL